MSDHARLSPSASDRWLSCPRSIFEIEALPQREDKGEWYTQEGTICHALAEIMGRHHFGKTTKSQATKELRKWRKDNGIDMHTENEMRGHVDTWLAILQEQFDQYPGSEIYFEQRLDTGVPSSWGTTDCAIVSPRHIFVDDFKYGAGVKVDAEDNSQLRLYGLGVLDEFDILGLVEDVTLVVVQPRIGDGHVSMERMSTDDLLKWRESIRPIAESALLPDAPYGPSSKACRWCPLSGKCKAQLEHIFEELPTDFDSDPALLSVEEVAELMPVIPLIKDWINSFVAQALHRAYDEGKEIPGYKVVMSGGRRSCANEEAVLDELKEMGHSIDDVTTKRIVGIGVLEGLLGKAEFRDKLGAFYPKSSGKPSLVPAEDKRPALNREAEAASVFGKVTDDII